MTSSGLGDGPEKFLSIFLNETPMWRISYTTTARINEWRFQNECFEFFLLVIQSNKINVVWYVRQKAENIFNQDKKGFTKVIGKVLNLTYVNQYLAKLSFLSKQLHQKNEVLKDKS